MAYAAASAVRLAGLTSGALLCFSANSILCRMALAPDLIDPATFTSLRVLSAVVMLTAGMWMKHRRLPRLAKAKRSSTAAVFVYLIFFSFAYTRLSAGTGALVLIAGAQFTMVGIALLRGERFSPLSWFGLAVAVAGVLYLLLPSATAPVPLGAVMMAIAGAAWGAFTILARGTDDPEETSASNMACCLLPAALVSLFWSSSFHATWSGVALSIASGAVATGLGYIAWYLALRNLSSLQAATVQLSMPAIVALAGVVFLAEPLTTRILIASAAMLGGIAIVLARRQMR